MNIQKILKSMKFDWKEIQPDHVFYPGQVLKWNDGELCVVGHLIGTEYVHRGVWGASDENESYTPGYFTHYAWLIPVEEE
jgi:hypothetical protein